AVGGRRPPQRSSDVRACRYLDHSDLYPRHAVETSGRGGETSPPGLNNGIESAFAMSDYIYMLESHLNPDQNRVVEEIQAATGPANVNLFLTGGAMRDMLAGFRIRDLDFVVEGNALKVAKTICERTGARIVSSDEH